VAKRGGSRRREKLGFLDMSSFLKPLVDDSNYWNLRISDPPNPIVESIYWGWIPGKVSDGVEDSIENPRNSIATP
jgi:hypothetical protein